MALKQLESSVEKAFVRKCDKLGVWQIKVGMDAMPDRLAISKTVWVEFKRPKEVPRKNQEVTIDRLRKLGYRVEVIDNSKDAIALAKELAED